MTMPDRRYRKVRSDRRMQYIPLGMSRKLVAQNSHPIYRSACLKVRLDLFRRGAVIDLSSSATCFSCAGMLALAGGTTMPRLRSSAALPRTCHAQSQVDGVLGQKSMRFVASQLPSRWIGI